MATVPTPYDATSGFKLTAADWDAGVRDVMTWLMTNRPRVHAWDSAGTTQNFTNGGTIQLVTFDSTTYDTDSMHAGATSRIIFNTAGLYDVDVMLTFTTGLGSFTAINIQTVLNGAGTVAGGTSLRNQPASGPDVKFRFKRFFNAGDYVEFFLTQTSGATRALSGTSLATRVFAEWFATT